MTREFQLRRRIKCLTWLFIAGLIFGGATAIPLQNGVDWLVKITGVQQMVETPAPATAPQWASG